ncbi:PREDICTED: uncharacterized protein LOC109188595 isoform X2 [Ipomoea nil]|uniref:uncharacterized protein LOC109188595 isoform X2 n=1 Tax=Ipomoea nil TaxID=35883 RepID=UPI0009014B42|nr:PREDICTED: uncharacterized protein LOC109188595 isoform X2 [Ipomoea nil]
MPVPTPSLPCLKTARPHSLTLAIHASTAIAANEATATAHSPPLDRRFLRLREPCDAAAASLAPTPPLPPLRRRRRCLPCADAAAVDASTPATAVHCRKHAEHGID